MAAIYRKYIRDLRKKFGYQATWTPGTPLKLGDIGIFRNHVFETVDNISNKNFDFEMLVREDDTDETLDFVSSNSINITSNISGNVLPTDSSVSLNDTGFDISFGKKGGLVFKAEGVRTQKIENQGALARFVKTAFSNGEWGNGHFIITELKIAQSATILYAVEKNGKVAIRANGSVEKQALQLTDAKAGLEITSSNSMAVQIVASDGLTPLFKVRGIRVKGNSASLKSLDNDDNDISFEENDDAGTLLDE